MQMIFYCCQGSGGVTSDIRCGGKVAMKWMFNLNSKKSKTKMFD